MTNLIETQFRGPDGSIDHDFYRRQALAARSAYLAEHLSLHVPAVGPAAKRRLGLFAAAFAIATAAFWATILTDPPKTEAAVPDPHVIEAQ